MMKDETYAHIGRLAFRHLDGVWLSGEGLHWDGLGKDHGRGGVRQCTP